MGESLEDMEHVSRVSREMTHGVHPGTDTIHQLVEVEGGAYAHVVQYSGQDGMAYRPAEGALDPTDSGLIYIRE